MRWGGGACPSRRAGSVLLSGYSCAPALCRPCEGRHRRRAQLSDRRPAVLILVWNNKEGFPEGLGDFLEKKLYFRLCFGTEEAHFQCQPHLPLWKHRPKQIPPPSLSFPICGHLSGAPRENPAISLLQTLTNFCESFDCRCPALWVYKWTKPGPLYILFEGLYIWKWLSHLEVWLPGSARRPQTT